MGHSHCLLWKDLNSSLNSIQEGDLPSSLSKHLKALRVDQGEEIVFLSGNGLRLVTQCTGRKPYVFNVLDKKQETPPPSPVTLALSLVKRDALSLALSQATEMGVDAVQILRSHNSDPSLKKTTELLSRAQRILDSATEQSQRSFIPKLSEEILSPQDYLNSLAPESAVIFANENLAQSGLYGFPGEVPSENSPLSLFIGPEGGWHPKEVEVLQNHPKVHELALGPHILKVPTAVCAALYQIRCR